MARPTIPTLRVAISLSRMLRKDSCGQWICTIRNKVTAESRFGENIVVKSTISLVENGGWNERKKHFGILAPILCIVDTGVIYSTHTTYHFGIVVDSAIQWCIAILRKIRGNVSHLKLQHGLIRTILHVQGHSGCVFKHILWFKHIIIYIYSNHTSNYSSTSSKLTQRLQSRHPNVFTRGWS